MDKMLQGMLILLAILSIILAGLYFIGIISNSYAVILSFVVAIVAIARGLLIKKDRA